MDSLEYDTRPHPIGPPYSGNPRPSSHRSSTILLPALDPSSQLTMPGIPPVQPSFFQPGISSQKRLDKQDNEDLNSGAIDPPVSDMQVERPPSEFVHPPQRPSSIGASPSVAQGSLHPERALDQPPLKQSSRRALTEALRLAQEAVLLDSRNDDPIAAFHAYSRSVFLLNEVMERVIRGERDGDQRQRPGKARSDVAREDEAKRLKSIHDTYAERMRILADIYDIPYEAHFSAPFSTSGPVVRLAPFNHATYVEQTPSVFHEGEHHRDVLADYPTTGSTSPSTPTLSDRQKPSLDSLRDSSSSESSLFTMQSRHNSASPTDNPPPIPLGRSSHLPPARPPPSGPPPSRPRAASASIQNALQLPSRRDSWEQYANGDSSHSLENAVLQPRLQPAKVIMDQPIASSYQNLHPLPSLPDSASLVSPLTPRVDLHYPPGAQSPESTPRQPSLVSYVSRASDIKQSTAIPAPLLTTNGNLVNATTAEGTIFQRRNKTSSASSASNGTSRPPSPPVQSPPAVIKLATLVLPSTSKENLQASRLRAASQPGHRPSLVANYSAPTGSEGGIRGPSRLATPFTANLLGSSNKLPSVTHLSPLQTQGPLFTRQNATLPTMPTSPLPPPSPVDPIRKPYHLMTLLRLTMTSRTGGYITRKLHVPHEVWSQGGAKLSNLPEKVRVIEVLCSALEELQIASSELFGVEQVGKTLGFGTPPSPSRKDSERWLNKLDDWCIVCESVVGNLGKKLGVGEGFAVKKSNTMTSWSTKFARSLDKLTNGKNLDSPATYVNGLVKLFQHAQLLDEHSKSLGSFPSIYSAQPTEFRVTLESRLKQSSEFFARVVLTFVIRDLSLLLDKYAKKGGQWLSE